MTINLKDLDDFQTLHKKKIDVNKEFEEAENEEKEVVGKFNSVKQNR